MDQHGGRRVTETSVIEFYRQNEKILLYNSNTLKSIVFLGQELFS